MFPFWPTNVFVIREEMECRCLISFDLEVARFRDTVVKSSDSKDYLRAKSATLGHNANDVCRMRKGLCGFELRLPRDRPRERTKIGREA